VLYYVRDTLACFSQQLTIHEYFNSHQRPFQEHAAGADAPSSGDVGKAATLLDRPLATQPTPSYDGARQAALPI
jgi:hypothetical protein